MCHCYVLPLLYIGDAFVRNTVLVGEHGSKEGAVLRFMQ